MSFETKDSGERLEFKSGMVRDVTTGKTLWHLVTSGPMLRRWAELLTRGAEKYSPDNWTKASGPEERQRFKESAFRHFMQWYNEETDEDHAAAVFFNINGKEYVDARTAVEPAREVGEEPGSLDAAAPAPEVEDLSGRDCAVCDVGGLHRVEQRTDWEDGIGPDDPRWHASVKTPFPSRGEYRDIDSAWDERYDPDLYGHRDYESSLD